MKIWLDDIRQPPDGWNWVQDAYGMIYLLDEYGDGVETISLDHDLGNDELYGTGYDVMKWLERKIHEYPDWHLPEIQFHSSNPIGIHNMQKTLEAIQAFKEANNGKKQIYPTKETI